jgi:hypothetical protein
VSVAVLVALAVAVLVAAGVTVFVGVGAGVFVCVGAAVLVAVGPGGSSLHRKLALFAVFRLFSRRTAFAFAGTLAVLRSNETGLTLPAAKV